MAFGCVPAHASYFAAYEHLKVYFDFKNEQMNFIGPMMIGASTTFIHDFFITPADCIKQRLQLCKTLTTMQCL